MNLVQFEEDVRKEGWTTVWVFHIKNVYIFPVRNKIKNELYTLASFSGGA